MFTKDVCEMCLPGRFLGCRNLQQTNIKKHILQLYSGSKKLHNFENKEQYFPQPEVFGNLSLPAFIMEIFAQPALQNSSRQTRINEPEVTQDVDLLPVTVGLSVRIPFCPSQSFCRCFLGRDSAPALANGGFSEGPNLWHQLYVSLTVL